MRRASGAEGGGATAGGSAEERGADAFGPADSPRLLGFLRQPCHAMPIHIHSPRRPSSGGKADGTEGVSWRFGETDEAPDGRPTRRAATHLPTSKCFIGLGVQEETQGQIEQLNDAAARASVARLESDPAHKTGHMRLHVYTVCRIKCQERHFGCRSNNGGYLD